MAVDPVQGQHLTAVVGLTGADQRHRRDAIAQSAQHLGLATECFDGDRKLRAGGLEEGVASVLQKDVTGIGPGEAGCDRRSGPDDG